LLFAHNGPVRLGYTVRGEDGPPTVFVHGYMARRQIWALQAAHFSRARRCLLYDRRGSGDSDVPDGAYGLEHQIGDLQALADEAGWDRFDLVGHSMGGFIAMAYAIEHPERVDRLGLIATAPYRTTTADFGVGVFITERGEPPRWDTEGIDRAVDLLVPESGAVWLRMELRRTIPEYSDPDQARQTFAVFEGVDLRPDLHRIGCPTHIIHGTSDTVVPLDVGRQLAAQIPGATFEAVEGLGHMLMITAAREVNRRLDRFLSAPR